MVREWAPRNRQRCILAQKAEDLRRIGLAITRGSALLLAQDLEGFSVGVEYGLQPLRSFLAGCISGRDLLQSSLIGTALPRAVATAPHSRCADSRRVLRETLWHWAILPSSAGRANAHSKLQKPPHAPASGAARRLPRLTPSGRSELQPTCRVRAVRAARGGSAAGPTDRRLLSACERS